VSAVAISEGAVGCLPPFKPLQEVPAWHETIKRYICSKVLAQCLAAKDRQCEVLMSTEKESKALAFFIYKFAMQDETLIVRTFKVIDPRNHIEEGYQLLLLKRIAAIAEQKEASKVIIDLPNESPLRDFLKNRGFGKIACVDSKYEEMFTQYRAATKDIDVEERGEKRKRKMQDGRPVINGRRWGDSPIPLFHQNRKAIKQPR